MTGSHDIGGPVTNLMLDIENMDSETPIVASRYEIPLKIKLVPSQFVVDSNIGEDIHVNDEVKIKVVDA